MIRKTSATAIWIVSIISVRIRKTADRSPFQETRTAVRRASIETTTGNGRVESLSVKDST
jgi:hypothetical protein